MPTSWSSLKRIQGLRTREADEAQPADTHLGQRSQGRVDRPDIRLQATTTAQRQILLARQDAINTDTLTQTGQIGSQKALADGAGVWISGMCAGLSAARCRTLRDGPEHEPGDASTV